MYPVLLTLGTWKLHANLAFFTLSCIVGILVGIKEARKIGGLHSLSKSYLIISFLIGITFSYFLGRLNGGLFVVFSRNLNWKALPYGGLISFGAMIGGFLYGFIVSKIFKFSALRILDLIALLLPLMESIYRIGCILMGCCFGRETDGFAGVYLPEVNGVWAYRYPTQIALMVFNLVLFIWLWIRKKKDVKPGSQAFIFLIVYNIGRFIIDTFRGDMPMVGLLGYHQIESIIIIFATVLVFLMLKRVKRV